MAIRSRQQKHKVMKTLSIDVNKKDVLNPFDQAHLDKNDLGSKAPVINYSTVVSDFNLNVQKNRQRKRAEADAKFKEQQDKEII